MPVVSHSQILRVHAAAVAVGLTATRNELLAGIPQSLVAPFPTAANASAQLLGDLDRLNDLGGLPDGSVPLRTWLQNALALSGPRSGAEVFREVLALAQAPAPASTASSSPETGSAPGGSTFHIKLQGSTIGGLAFGDGATASGAVHAGPAMFTSGPPVAAPGSQPSAWATSGTATAATAGLQSIYLSYGAADEPFVERLFHALEARGVATFYFPEHAPAGEKLHRTARVGVNQHDRVLLVCSRASLTDARVQNELEQTLEREAREGGSSRLIPVNLDNFARSPEWKPPHPDVIHEIQGRVMVEMVGAEGDTKRFDQGIERLFRALKG